MKNIIENIKYGAHKENVRNKCGYELARHIADEHQEKTGNRCIVERVLDYTDSYNDEPRYHYSFDVIEIV